MPSDTEAVKLGYALAGRLNRTVEALKAAIAPAFTDAAAPTATYLDYVLAKSVYMLHMVSVTGGSPCNPEFWLDSAEFVKFVLRPEFQFPQAKGVKGITETAADAAAPIAEIEAMCTAVHERCERNRETMGMGDEDSELEEMGAEADDESDLDEDMNFVGFWDDSDFEDVDWSEGEGDSDDEDDSEDYEDDEEDDDEAAWSDEEEHDHGHSHDGGHSHGHSHSHAHGAGCSH